MEKKDLFLILILPILLFSAIYLAQNASITGLAVNPQNQPQDLGTYSVLPSFRAKANYSMKDFLEIRKSFDEILNCIQSGNDAQKCAEKRTNDKFEWGFDCDKGQEYALYDFSRFLEECIHSDDSNCICRKNLEIKPEEIKKHELFSTLDYFNTGSYKLSIVEEPQTNTINIFVDEPKTSEKLSYVIDSRGITGLIPRKYLIGYTANGFHSVNMFFTNNLEAPGPLKQLAIYKYKDTNNKILIDFVKEDNDKLVYPNGVKNKPAGIKDCRIPNRNIYKFCVTGKNSNVTYYDFIDDKIKERKATLKFASYIPNLPPPPVLKISASDRPVAQNSILLKWQKSSDAAKYRIYLSEDQNLLKANPIQPNGKIILNEIDSNDAMKLVFEEEVDTSLCNFDLTLNKCIFFNKKGDKLPFKDENFFYYYEKTGNFVYSLPVPSDEKTYFVTITPISKEGRENSNDQKLIMAAKSIDDLAPGKISDLKIENSGAKIKLSWIKPLNNLDGSLSNDISGFFAYYKKYFPTTILEAKVDSTYSKTYVSTLNAKCDNVKLTCEHLIDNPEKGPYNFAVVAIDTSSNEFLDNAVMVPFVVG